MQSTAGDEMVGRGPLFDDVADWLTPALAGHGRAMLLTGEPGIGKSTLVEAVCSWAAGAGFHATTRWRRMPLPVRRSPTYRPPYAVCRCRRSTATLLRPWCVGSAAT